MRSLPLLVLLLFSVVARTAEPPAVQSPPSTVIEELLADGGRRRFKSFNDLYLTDGQDTYLWALPLQELPTYQDWTIVHSDKDKIAIRSTRGYYISHGTNNYARQHEDAYDWMSFTPVKNVDGSWSFLSMYDRWLSANNKYGPERFNVDFMPEKRKCEKWTLESNYTRPSNPLMEELLANGAPRRFKSFNKLYLTDDRPQMKGLTLWTQPRQDWGPFQDWTIVQINKNEVAIKSSRGHFIGHGSSHYAVDSKVVEEWEMLTPVKNVDGTWSFKSRWGYWLSAHDEYDPQRYYVYFMPENKGCEHWWLESNNPRPANQPHMAELLAIGGIAVRLRAYDGRYLTYTGTTFLAADAVAGVRDRTEKRSQQWKIIQINMNEVIIRLSGSNLNIRHGDFNYANLLTSNNILTTNVDAWEMLTPVKNPNGSWSFKSRDNKWLSAATGLNFKPENKKCERWILEPW